MYHLVDDGVLQFSFAHIVASVYSEVHIANPLAHQPTSLTPKNKFAKESLGITHIYRYLRQLALENQGIKLRKLLFCYQLCWYHVVIILLSACTEVIVVKEVITPFGR